MEKAAQIAVALLAALHVYILVLEMFLWDKPRGLRAFGLTPSGGSGRGGAGAGPGGVGPVL
jgi:putative membrane protein